MGLERAATLYPNNDTTVDTGTGIDVRVLTATSGTVDQSQSVRWTHTQDGQSRTWDPATGLATSNFDPTALQKLGWALRLSNDMTPTDDTNCDAILIAGTCTITIRAHLNMNGGTNLGGTNTFSMKAALFKYNPATDSGSLIASGSATQTWDTSVTGGENNTYKATDVSIVVPAGVVFGAVGGTSAEVLMLQLGATATTLVDATLGTTNYDMTLEVRGSVSKIAWASGQSIAQVCTVKPTGAFTPAGSITRKVPLKVLLAGITPVAVLKRVPLKFYSGNITPVGTLVRIPFKILASSVASSSVLRRIPFKALGSSQSSSSSFQKVPFKSLTGVNTPTGSITRKVAIRLLSGVITPVGTLVKIPLRKFSGTIATASAVRTTVVKYLTGFISPNGVLFRAIAKFFSGTIGSSGVLKRIPFKRLNSSVASASSLRNTVSKNLKGFFYGPAGDGSGGGGTIIKRIAQYIFDD